MSDLASYAVSTATVALLLGFPILLWHIWDLAAHSMSRYSHATSLPFWTFDSVYDVISHLVETITTKLSSSTKTYVITKPQDVSRVFANQHAFDNDHSLRETLVAFGVSSDDLKRAWHVPQGCETELGYILDDAPNNNNPQPPLCFIKWVQHSYRQHLSTAATQEKMAGVFRDSLLDSIHRDSIGYCVAGDDDIFSLNMMIRNVMVEASAQSMFGPHLHEIDPNVIENMLCFNDNAWQLFNQSPNLFGRLDVSEAQKKMMATMRKFVQRPREHNKLANSFIHNVLAQMDVSELSMDARSSVLLMIFWLAISNEYNATFWLMAHTVHDAALMQQVREETDAAWQGDEVDTQRLTEHCPTLEAVWNEVLRHKNGGGVHRLAKEKIQLGDEQLRPDDVAYVPFQQLHTDESVWGARSQAFDHTRFLNNKSLASHPSFRPFGGGATRCPGMTAAKRQAFAAVAIFLRRFEMRPAGASQRFPPLDAKTPSLGVNGPAKGADLIVEMTDRQITVERPSFIDMYKKFSRVRCSRR